MRRTFLPAAVVAATACMPAEELSLPQVPEARSALLIAGDPAAPTMLAVELPLEDTAVALRHGPVLLLYYAHPLRVLALEDDRVYPREGEPVRPPPPPMRAFEGVVGASTGGGLVELDVAELLAGERFAAIELRGLSTPECFAYGGCFAELACALPCEAPAPEPPLAPARVRAADPCPSGWRLDSPADRVGPLEMDAFAATTCVPEATATCPAGELFLPSLGACRRVGSACAEWPAGEAQRYVRPGSAAPPEYPTVEAALAGARDGDVIALARGVFEDEITIAKAVTIRGACTESVLPDVIVASAGVRLENLSIGAGGLTVAATAAVFLESVSISGGRISSSGHTTGTLVRVSGAEDAALVVLSGTVAIDGADLGDSGLGADVRGGEVTLADAAVHDVVEIALKVEGGDLTLERSQVEHASTGLEIRSGSAALTDVVFRDTHGDAWNHDIRTGRAIEALSRSNVRGVRVDIDRAWGGAMLFDHSSTGTFTDLVITNTLSQSAYGGLAIAVTERSELEVERALIAGFAKGLLEAVGPLDRAGARAVVRDLAAGAGRTDTFPMVNVSHGRVSLQRAQFEDADAPLAYTLFTTHTEEPNLEVHDLDVLRVRGGGVAALHSSRVIAERVRMRDIGGFGMSSHYEEGSIVATDVEIDGVGLYVSERSECFNRECSGNGIQAMFATSFDLERFVVRRAAKGVRTARDNVLRARAGLVTTSSFGVSITGDDETLRRALQGVLVRDNIVADVAPDGVQ